MHNHDKEITDIIIQNDKEKENEEKNIEVEHLSINFEMLIIAEKIRALEKGRDPSKLVFNDLYYSTLLIN